MNNTVILSCILCAFNAEKTVLRTLGSLITSSKINYEIIIIDDGSTDSTKRLIEIYKNFANIKIISQENSGLGAARNKGLKAAVGEYVIFCDSDDVFFIDNLLNLASEAESGGYDIACSESYALVDSTEISDFWDTHIIKMMSKSSPEVFSFAKYLLQPSVCNKLFNRKFIIAADIKFGEGVLFEDVQFTTHALLSTRKIMLSKKPVFLYDFHGNGSITSNKSLKRFDIFKNMYAVMPIVCGCKLNKLEFSAICISFMRISLWCLDNIPVTHVEIFKKYIMEFFTLIKSEVEAQHLDIINKILSDRWDRRANFMLGAIWHSGLSDQEISGKFEEANLII
ncbi:glycosyltransferase family 2 protein [Limnohabitans sp.]|uniref:glycosyltransferase family 2 protein n=1 Tax=Limnohabitans sp. TaxID=1907725 RepID=UPI002AFF19E1|nr:glycosyltransferase family 2 protein [Limnohabitans sp.]